MKEIKEIKETKCSCQACGEVWFYGKDEQWDKAGEKIENCGNEMSNLGRDMMCCSGCLPAAFLPIKPTKEIRDLDQCANCGSRAVSKEVVVHRVK